MLTYAGDPGAQSKFVQYATGQALVRWCVNRAAAVGEGLYFLIDEVDALDTDSESLGVHGRAAAMCEVPRRSGLLSLPHIFHQEWLQARFV